MDDNFPEIKKSIKHLKQPGLGPSAESRVSNFTVVPNNVKLCSHCYWHFGLNHLGLTLLIFSTKKYTEVRKAPVMPTKIIR